MATRQGEGKSRQGRYYIYLRHQRYYIYDTKIDRSVYDTIDKKEANAKLRELNANNKSNPMEPRYQVYGLRNGLYRIRDTKLKKYIGGKSAHRDMLWEKVDKMNAKLKSNPSIKRGRWVPAHAVRFNRDGSISIMK